MAENGRPGRILALIPAKEGSRRLPAKNIRPLAGVSLLERTIRVAHKTGLFQRLCVSTESERVAAIARQAGVDMPFMRPPELARDPAGVVEVALHALDEWSGGVSSSIPWRFFFRPVLSARRQILRALWRPICACRSIF